MQEPSIKISELDYINLLQNPAKGDWYTLIMSINIDIIENPLLRNMTFIARTQFEEIEKILQHAAFEHISSQAKIDHIENDVVSDEVPIVDDDPKLLA